MAMSDYLENAIAKHTVGIANFPMPTNVYLALFTADPTDTGDLSGEVNAADYTRLLLNGKINVTSNVISNTQVLDFAPAANPWGTIGYLAIVDAQTAGNILYHGALVNPKTINTNDVFAILAGDLTITLN